MAHPKRKISKTRRDKRRTHHKLTDKVLRKCHLTGKMHPIHEAYESEGITYYRGRVLIAASKEAA